MTASVSANDSAGGASDPATTSTYDANNNWTSTTIPTTATVSATYAGAGQPFQPDKVRDDRDPTGAVATTTVTYSPKPTKPPPGAVISGETYTYDPMNRRVTEKPAAATPDTLTWDANSNLAGFTDSSGTINYGYDNAATLNTIAQPGGSCAGFSPANPGTVASGCTVIQLDKDGNRQAIMFPGNNVRQEYVYDISARVVKTVGRLAGNPTAVYDINYTYDPYGVKTTTTPPPFTQPFNYTGAYTNQSSPYPYPYTGDDPINNSDRSGLGVDFWTGFAAVLVGGIAAVATGGLALGAVGFAEAAVFGGTIGLGTTDAVVNGIQDYQNNGQIDVPSSVGQWVGGLY